MKLPESVRKYLFLVVATAAVFLFDWLTPLEVSVGPVYLLLVGYTRWQLGLRTAIVMAIVCPLLWALADYLDGHRFVHDWILAENVGVRVFTHSLIVAAVSLYKRTLEAHRRRLEEENIPAPPESLAQLPSVQPKVAAPPESAVVQAAPEAPLSPEVVARPIPAGAPEAFASVREPFRPSTFVELLDASLALHGD